MVAMVTFFETPCGASCPVSSPLVNNMVRGQKLMLMASISISSKKWFLMNGPHSTAG